MRKICLEEHWFHASNDSIRKRLAARSNATAFDSPTYFENFHPKMISEAIETRRIPEMDEFDVDIQMLSGTYPSVSGLIDTDEAIATAKQVNDDMYAIIQKHPTRFKGWGTIALQDVKAACDEFERCIKDYGFIGVLINGGQTNGEYIDEKKFWPVWETASALNVPIYLHPSDPEPDQISIYRGYRPLLGPSWSWDIGPATETMRIMYSGVFDAFPNCTLMIGHMGEMLPFMLGRIDEGYYQVGAGQTWGIKRPPSYYYQNNVMITTSGQWRPEALVCALSAIGEDRIMFAVDYPYVETATSVAQIENTPISDEVKEKIYYKNAAKFFGL